MSDLNYALESTAKGAAILFIGLIFSKFFTYGYRLIVARIGTESYGLISLGLVIVGILGTFAMLGTNIGVHRYVAFFHARKQEDKIKGTLFSSIYITFILSVVFSVAVFIFAEYISINFFNNSGLIDILKIMSISIPFFAFSTLFMFALQAFNRSNYSAYGKYIAEGITKLLFAAILIYMGYETLGAAWAFVLSSVISTILLLYYLNKVFPLFTQIKPKYNYKELLTFSWPLVFSTIFWMLMAYLDTLMIGVLRSTSEVGIYNAAAPTSYLLLMFPIAFGFIFLPIVTMLYSKKKYNDMKNASTIVFKWNLLFLTPLFVLFVLFAEDILGILFGSDYVIGAMSLIILSVGYFIYGWFSFTTELLKLIKKTKLIVSITVASLLLNIVLNFVLIQEYGIMGAAIATTTSFVLYSILTTVVAFKLMKVNLITPKNISILAAGGISAIVTYFLLNYRPLLDAKLPYLLTLVVYLIVFLAVFWIVIYFTKSIDKEDLLFIRGAEKKTGLN